MGGAHAWIRVGLRSRWWVRGVRVADSAGCARSGAAGMRGASVAPRLWPLPAWPQIAAGGVTRAGGPAERPVNAPRLIEVASERPSIRSPRPTEHPAGPGVSYHPCNPASHLPSR